MTTRDLTDATRLAALERLSLLDTTPEQAFERLTRVASLALAAPIALVGLVGDDTQYFKACFGLDLHQTHRKLSFCTHAILHDHVMVVPDATRDPRFATNPMVTGDTHIRFYAGAPFRSPDGIKLGTLCVLDTQARHDFGSQACEVLAELAAAVGDTLEARQVTRAVAEERAFIQAVLDNVSDSIVACNAGGDLTLLNAAARSLHGLDEQPLGPDTWADAYDLYEGDGVTPLSQERVPLYRAYRGEVVRDAEIVVAPAGKEARQLLVSGRAFSDPHGKTLGAVVAMHDVTLQRQAQKALSESEAHHRTLVSTLIEGVVQQEADGRISTCNPAAERILGLTREQMLGRDSLDPLWRVVHEDGSPYPGDQRPAMLALRTGVAQRDEIMGVYRGDGILAWILTNAEPLYRADEDDPYAVVSSFADITALKDTEARLRHEAIHDALTGLPARRLLADRLTQAAARAARHPKQHYALLFIDLDNFKGVNDALGHQAGDDLLVKVAGLLSQCVRQGDTVARLGGDEFVILLEGLNDPSDARALAKRVLNELTLDVRVADVGVSVSASIGVAFPSLDVAGVALLDQADRAMYRAKAAGKSRVAVASLSSLTN